MRNYNTVIKLAIRNYHNAGDMSAICVPLARLAASFVWLGRRECAATFTGFAASPLTEATIPELSAAIAHLREILGDLVYESLARKARR